MHSFWISGMLDFQCLYDAYITKNGDKKPEEVPEFSDKELDEMYRIAAERG